MLAGELRDRVDAARAWHVRLRVGLLAVAREDVVRAQVDELRPGVGATLRQALDRPGVHLEGAVHLALTDLDVVEGRAVEDDGGTDGLERHGHLPLV